MDALPDFIEISFAKSKLSSGIARICCFCKLPGQGANGSVQDVLLHLLWPVFDVVLDGLDDPLNVLNFALIVLQVAS